MEPSFETGTVGAWTVVTVRGELDLASGDRLRAALDDGLAHPEPRVAVNLSDVTFMDSSSLGILLASLKHAHELGGELRLVGVQGSPARVLELSGLDDTFVVEPSIADLPA
jgi:anti-sigma B factor antagonist